MVGRRRNKKRRREEGGPAAHCRGRNWAQTQDRPPRGPSRHAVTLGAAGLSGAAEARVVAQLRRSPSAQPQPRGRRRSCTSRGARRASNSKALRECARARALRECARGGCAAVRFPLCADAVDGGGGGGGGGGGDTPWLRAAREKGEQQRHPSPLRVLVGGGSARTPRARHACTRAKAGIALYWSPRQQWSGACLRGRAAPGAKHTGHIPLTSRVLLMRAHTRRTLCATSRVSSLRKKGGCDGRAVDPVSNHMSSCAPRRPGRAPSRRQKGCTAQAVVQREGHASAPSKLGGQPGKH